ncbi:SPOUT methyltransferase, putative [Medicago truncatula]|uniref:SPOUT methyltransferase, putative n=1 Tax=Medicago truncatula TaxID=3880 RepID=A0A072VNR3_MEDTR|nr:SPOUT methyltransferase, putative [Medicago truncatula]
MGSAFQLSAGLNLTGTNLVHIQGKFVSFQHSLFHFPNSFTKTFFSNIFSASSNSKFAPQSVRALPIRILSVGKKRSPGLQLMVDEYIEKIKYYCSVEDVQIRSNPRNARDHRAQVDDEDMAVMNLIRSDDWVVMLDERGQDLRSEQMAELVADAGNTQCTFKSQTIEASWVHFGSLPLQGSGFSDPLSLLPPLLCDLPLDDSNAAELESNQV